MSWLEKLLPPKIQPTDPAERRSVPEGLWVKCPSCETVLYKNDLEANVNVCPKCGHHHRIGARARRTFGMLNRDIQTRNPKVSHFKVARIPLGLSRLWTIIRWGWCRFMC